MGFEIPTPVFEQAKKFHASDRVATVIGKYKNSFLQYGIRKFVFGKSKIHSFLLRLAVPSRFLEIVISLSGQILG
jgi:hypothetical protein